MIVPSATSRRIVREAGAGRRKRKCSLVLGYVGTRFHGFQSQEPVEISVQQQHPTVEHVILKALVERGLLAELNSQIAELDAQIDAACAEEDFERADELETRMRVLKEQKRKCEGERELD